MSYSSLEHSKKGTTKATVLHREKKRKKRQKTISHHRHMENMEKQFKLMKLIKSGQKRNAPLSSFLGRIMGQGLNRKPSFGRG